ncbi:hypothetical protein [Malaciobacter mytili]|uniref:Uncharacterized protein n=1 Tax=Malaciobacter mytili LMG 24559 TaxID=1032238 RepID=A0AAX2ACB2_9BACT|nr:hypothetical protein [Malaciobacter mytili]AXH13658.1 hypothetical protein AMYT_0031 [Malaciobacter mytili LMG 24559]RXI44658.1 hypothetical protein CRU99_04745 [Malaciobacter mytili]RXK13841.1 hypothetical protein CP985_12915 [Malaciobacter mytili LMG 24559]
MIEIASKIVLCLVIAAILGFIIGFLIGKATRKQQYASVPEKSSKNVGNIYNKPLIFSCPRPAGKDDLKQIEGIDSVIEAQLNHLGIFHFDQIANWSIKNCEWIENYLDIKERISQENWVEQAKAFTKPII